MTTWVEANIIKVKKWTPNLFTLFLQAPILPFIAGQFTKLSILDYKKHRIQRAYSFVNSPKNKLLEFYIVLIPEGKITKKLYNLQPFEKIMISKRSFGFFTLSEIPYCKHLWMFATGTAIGPYCSILQECKNVERFERIILIHAVRYVTELNYLPLMLKLEKLYNGKLQIITVVSREQTPHSFTGRIPQLLLNKKIEKKAKLKINTNDSHIMLCGNPSMVKDTTHCLINNYNMRKHYRRKNGHITIESYW